MYTLINSNLYHATINGNLGEIKKFLEKGADPNYQEGMYTVLQAAIIHDQSEAATYLLANGANPNLKSSHTGLTPLMEAKSGNMVRLLAKYNADPGICDENKNNAFTYYTSFNCKDAIKAWLDLKWPTKALKLHDQLLAQGKFEMVTALTGFRFTEKNSNAKIAEFNSRYRNGSIHI